MAGLEPEWVMPIIDPASGVPLGVDPAVVAARLDESKAKAVYVVEPGYMGTRSDVQALARVSHERGVPLCVDQAWGAHHGFHPGVPRHALQDGADALVTSMHKAVPGYSGACMVVARTKYLDPARLDQAFEVQHTTSPAGAPLASCDGVRALLQLQGHDLLEKLLVLVDNIRDQLLNEFGPGIALDPRKFKPGQLDRSKLVITTACLGADGVQVERDLLERGIRLELADRDTLVPIITIVNNAEEVKLLTKELIASLNRRRGKPRVVETALSWSITPTRAMSLRDAFFAKVEVVPAARANGRISADLIAPYPPGVPVVAPGERFTPEILRGLQAVADSGVRVAYASDPSLKTYRVVR
jgi:lysine decarboxylase